MPYAYVRDLAVSLYFYSVFAFESISSHGGRGQTQWWLHLQVERARLMLSVVSEPLVAQAQEVLFYLTLALVPQM